MHSCLGTPTHAGQAIKRVARKEAGAVRREAHVTEIAADAVVGLGHARGRAGAGRGTGTGETEEIGAGTEIGAVIGTGTETGEGAAGAVRGVGKKTAVGEFIQSIHSLLVCRYA